MVKSYPSTQLRMTIIVNRMVVLTQIHPKLPMRDKSVTKDFYVTRLGFEISGSEEYKDYLMVQKDNIQIHFFEFREIDPLENYGQVYIRTDNVDEWYRLARTANLKCSIPEDKSWGQREFSIHDPDNNLLTFGQKI